VWLILWTIAVTRVVLPATGHDWNTLLEPWRQWDARWYLEIAANGYSTDQVSTAFFPLYPIAIKFIGLCLNGQYLLASLIVSNIAALGCFIMLYRTAAKLVDEHMARRATVLFSVFPTAIFLFAGYTEALFLFLCLIFMDQLSRGQWLFAGLYGALASATRVPGVLLIVPFVFEWVRQSRQRKVQVRDLCFGMLVPSGALLYALYLYVQFGNALLFFDSARVWRDMVLPWIPLMQTVRVIATGVMVVPNVIELTVTLIFIGLTVQSFFTLPKVYGIFMAMMILLPLSTTFNGSTAIPLAAMSRYVLVAFPAFILLPLRLSVSSFLLVVTICAVLQTLFCMLFMQSFYVG
jgi:hypothetical protein